MGQLGTRYWAVTTERLSPHIYYHHGDIIKTETTQILSDYTNAMSKQISSIYKYHISITWIKSWNRYYHHRDVINHKILLPNRYYHHTANKLGLSWAKLSQTIYSTTTSHSNSPD